MRRERKNKQGFLERGFRRGEAETDSLEAEGKKDNSGLDGHKCERLTVGERERQRARERERERGRGGGSERWSRALSC